MMGGWGVMREYHRIELFSCNWASIKTKSGINFVGKKINSMPLYNHTQQR